MAISELHSRLEHLVTYSSQLIFVSGDTIGDQKHSLHTFLGQQSENTEVAFVNAEIDESLQSYRRQISKQLLGDDQGLFNRPLNEVLASLNHHDGPVLICICQGENLPQVFLQELWDLVLQSRFAGNKQHLNVLLFGQTQWAEQAKSWLPAKNRDKPLLLSTESVTALESPPSELDALIAQKRAQFEQRLKLRAQSQTPPPSSISSWWFRIFIALAFLSAFSGILMWQYSSELSDLWPTQEMAAQTADSAQSTPPSDPVAEEKSTEPDAGTDALIANAPEYEIVQQNTDQKLVTTWEDSLQRQSDKPSELQAAALPEVEQDIPVDTTRPLASTATIEVTPEQPLDYPVEDIVSVEQLPEPTSGEITSNDEVADVPPAAEPPLEANTVSQPQPESEPVIESLSALPANLFVVQVAAMADEKVMREFIADNQLNELLWIYKTSRFGGDWFVLLHQGTFSTLRDARNHIQQLPVALQKGTPFAKSVAQVQRELATQGSLQLQ